jgi:NTE family protein
MTLSLDAAESALTRYSLAAHAPDVLITVPKDACRTADFHRAAELIDLGQELAGRALDRAPLEQAGTSHGEGGDDGDQPDQK